MSRDIGGDLVIVYRGRKWNCEFERRKIRKSKVRGRHGEKPHRATHDPDLPPLMWRKLDTMAISQI